MVKERSESPLNSLIVFAKPLKIGKAKTRIAKTHGDKAAYLVYEQLLHHTVTILDELKNTNIHVFLSEREDESFWHPYPVLIQKGTDLGTKMQHAFNEVPVHHKKCIIGSDCFELNTAHLEMAFRALDEYDVVIGPALDGGYYLLGCKKVHQELFHNITWSTDQVLRQTLEQVDKLKLSYYMLPVLQDVDYWNDVPTEIKQLVIEQSGL